MSPERRGMRRDDDDDFWNSRSELKAIRQMARARRASPWATLGIVLVRVLATVHPRIVLPALRGGEASLNIFAGICGPSGQGKDVAFEAAEAIFPEEIYTATLGSGEGIAHQYMQLTDGEVVQYNDTVLWRCPEVKTLGALKSRSASTLLPELCKAWMGQPIGFGGYVARDRRLPMGKHTYRLGLVIGIQDENAGIILDDADSGTPQRFLWLPTTDPGVPDVRPSEPVPLGIKFGRECRANGNAVIPGKARGLRGMRVCASVKAAVEAEAVRSLNPDGDGDALRAHEVLAREKAAAALALLAGCADKITEEDWELAGHVVAVSDRTRDAIVAKSRASAAEANRQRGRQEGERSVIASTVIEKSAQKKAEQSVMTRLGPEWASRSRIRRKITPARRPYIDEALDRLVSAGKAEHLSGEYQGQDGDYYRVPQ
jgi:hypothetical protein